MARNRAVISTCLLVAAAAAACGDVSTTRPAPASYSLQDALESLRAADYDAAQEQASFLALSEAQAQPRSWLVAAAARQRNKQYASAVRAYRAYLTSCDSTPLREYVLGQVERCEAAAKAPAADKPPSVKLTKQEFDDLSAVGEKTYVESSEHFIIRSKNAKLSMLMARQCEEALQRICQDILRGQEFPHSVEVYVWADQQDFLANNKGAADWAGGSFSITTSGGVATRRIDLRQLEKDGSFSRAMLDRVLPHELCHLTTREYFGDAPCPLFLNEGLAMLAEWQVDNDRLELAGAALSGKEAISLDNLLVRQEEEGKNLPAFYAESLSFTEFLRGRLTPRQFSDFLDHVKGGCTVSDALQRALYISQDDKFMPALAEAWQDHAVSTSQIIRVLKGKIDSVGQP